MESTDHRNLSSDAWYHDDIDNARDLLQVVLELHSVEEFVGGVVDACDHPCVRTFLSQVAGNVGEEFLLDLSGLRGFSDELYFNEELEMRNPKIGYVLLDSEPREGVLSIQPIEVGT